MTNKADKPSVEGLMALVFAFGTAEAKGLGKGTSEGAAAYKAVSQYAERLASQSAAAPPIVPVEAFSELLRGLEMPPTSAALPPSALYAIGAAIARQAKRATPPSSDEDRKRIDFLLDWFEADGKRTELFPDSHIRLYTKEQRIAAIDAAIAALRSRLDGADGALVQPSTGQKTE